MIDRHLLAAFSLGGTLLDLIGGLYLAYDLLGGKKGPLRVITRIATYSVTFGVGYALPLGLRYGLVATVSPFIEWWADNLPERHLGFFGAMLVLAGIGLQSAPVLGRSPQRPRALILAGHPKRIPSWYHGTVENYQGRRGDMPAVRRSVIS